ncbi:FAD/NAD(P)-binding domain-containing protein [Cucurbitaria berberidis CBS 394.84]|uniref:FAD/NAD(P)-binding domain-containing protein n=1 Tax=Cucurbitaria berberidis CBS 394.84 TaxID=1168544 RepID=A0A9P4GM88_9PLEO|nr:FAD/NAD(P)-binding domain-containing protein [Cucurbitaria berberidis CBS 394.84]KAF1847797.1 FAD/NAD(P)-binding domain-containing protein [Cucurbitaria berberidis CBS 394.84]
MDHTVELKFSSLNLNANDANGNQVQELDALVVGAGFGGVYQLKVIRDAGYKVKLVEHGDDYGGVWYWNRYPGARVDSSIPHYEFSDPKLWKDWTWKQRFPGGPELRAYFAHVADLWDLRKDTQFNTFVSSATWNDSEARWTVKTKAAEVYKVKYLLLNTGFAAKRYIPDWKGIDSFKGTFLHPSYWPHEEPDLKGKRVAVIGTGSTGIQIAQELSKVASQLTVFQRTPNMSLPMAQVEYDLPKQALPKSEYPNLFAGRNDSFSGFSFNFLPRSTFEDTPEERQKTYEGLWSKGDFEFWLATYYDMLFDPKANGEAYKFWRDKTRARINESKVADILAPIEQPYAFGCKRISLEDEYFEIYNKPNVSLVDISNKGTPIQGLTEKGIKTTDKEYEFDFIVCATGYDAITGGLRQIDIRGPSGESLSDYWKAGAKTYLGLTVSGFPNMFFTYGPQAPTALCNGPTCAELQGNWILNMMNHMKENSLKKIDAQKESEAQYKELIWKLANVSLLPTVDSWYMGTNIPGKPREPLIYLGGVPTYYKTINEAAANGYTGFSLS